MTKATPALCGIPHQGLQVTMTWGSTTLKKFRTLTFVNVATAAMQPVCAGTEPKTSRLAANCISRGTWPKSANHIRPCITQPGKEAE